MIVNLPEPFQPNWTEKGVEEGLKFLRETHRKQPVNRNGMYAIYNADGQSMYAELRGDCHAGVASGWRGSAFIATLTHTKENCNRTSYCGGVDPIPKEIPFEEVRDLWYDWLINRSFISAYVYPTGLKTAVDLGLIISTEIPANLVGAACMLSRHLREKFGREIGRAS